MDQKDRKAKIDELQTNIARGTSPEVKLMLELWDLLLEDVRDRIVAAEGSDIPRLQGEARFLERFSKQMTAASALLRSGARS